MSGLSANTDARVAPIAPKRALTLAVSLALAATIGMSAGCGRSHSEEEVTANAPVPVSTQPAARGTVEAVTTATGVIAAAPGAELIVIAPQAARIAKLPKGEGDAVRKGDLLVEFDIPSSGADVAAREAEVAQSQAKLTNARNALTRLQGLLERGIAARKEVEDAQRDVAESQAAVANAEAARTAAQRVAARTTVEAPFAGVVAKRFHNPGDLVEAAATDPVLRIVDPARAEVTAAIPATVANRVKAGQTARIRAAGADAGAGAAASAPASGSAPAEAEAGRAEADADAGDGAQVWRGSVLTRPTVVDPATATASVRIALASKATAPPIGTAVRVDIITDVHKTATTVPGSAIVQDDGKTFVYVVGDDKKAHRREVKVGIASEAAMEIVSGVKPGEQVIVRGQAALPDGAAIRVEGAESKEAEPKGKESKGPESKGAASKGADSK
jgi:RND family efflux transporter MFP subunit